jgi:probable F420-dependent oxidoreductase
MEYWVNALLVPAEELLPLAQAADELGYTGIALADHSVMPEVIDSQYPGGKLPWDTSMTWPDVWVQIGAMAAVTRRLRFATNVYILPARHPLVAARAVATAAAISGDRVVLGVGVGWMAEEFEALGERFDNRGARANEALEILRMAFEEGVVEFAGDHYEIPKVHLRPAPARPIPIWVGGESPAALRRAARFGDGWISGRSPISMKPRIEELMQQREAAGRAHLPFALSSSASQSPTDADLAAWSDVGIEHLKVQPWTWEGAAPHGLEAKIASLERFAAGSLG